MRAYDPVGNRKSQSTATCCTRPCWISTVEALKDVEFIFRGNADSRVTYRKIGNRIVHFDVQRDCSPLVGVSECVIYEAHHHLNETCCITQHGSWLQGLYLELDATLNRQRLHARRHIAGEQIKPHRLAVE